MHRDLTRPAVWAPVPERVDLVLADDRQPMLRDEHGWWHAELDLEHGQRYAFSLDGADPLPDPRSLRQPDGVHGPSAVVDPHLFQRDLRWPGRDLRGAVLYELHVGTFTEAGTFDGAAARLPELAELGIDAVEVMPIADFPGHRGWGYDGVGLFCVHEAYGGPEGFVRFIDAAHAHGLGVVLDVVHNHLGPEGNYLSRFGPYFTDNHETPWGGAVNLDGRGSREVRRFLLQSARQWLVDFGVDGLRLDAVHELGDDSDYHFLAELSDAVAGWEKEVHRPLTLIAESDLNDPRMISPVGSSPDACGMDAQWADDVHHALHSFLTQETQGYYVDFGPIRVLDKALRRGFVRDGGHDTFRGQEWGAPVDPDSRHYDGHSFVVFLQNHDQVGNRATGDRIGGALEPGQQAAGAALYLLSAFTPMIFMGEEWASSSPFPYFSHLGDELGPFVTDGRAAEFARMGWAEPTPDPQAEDTFHSAKLTWAERDDPAHARMLDWYRTLLRLRRDHEPVRDPSLRSTLIDLIDDDTLVMRRGDIAVGVTRATDRSVDLELGRQVLASWDEPVALGGGRYRLQGPGVIIVAS